MRSLFGPCSSLRCATTAFSFGISLFITGCIFMGLFPTVLQMLVRKNIVIQEGKETFEKWKRTPIPVSFTVYMYNVTNPKEVQERGSKPILEEIGPYVFQQTRSKEILHWDDENNTVTYKDMKVFHFIPELSADQDVKVYTLNMPLMGIMNRVKNAGIFKDLLLGILDHLFATYKENLFVYRTPREMLFEGYRVDLVADLLKIARQFVTVPDVIPNNTFGYLYGRNESGNGIFTVYTGEDDISKYSQVIVWNDKTFIEDYGDKYCGMINGTDGSQFAPPVTRYETLYVFTPEICRSVHVDYVSDVFVQDILTYRFMTPEHLFASASENPDNKCFCTISELCNVSGILDISRCQKGMPIFVSAPHFYKGHPSYIDGVVGLSPSQEEHETYVDIEPTTGVVLRASRKLQMNYFLESYDGLPQTSNAPKALLPLFWLREEASIDTTIAHAFTSKVKTPVTVAKSILTACIVLGILWIAIAGVVTVYIVLKQQKATKKPYHPVPLKPEENGEKSEKFSPVNA